MSNYYRLHLKNVLASDEEMISSICFDAGASGVSEKLDFIQESLHYEPEFIKKDVVALEVFFEKKPEVSFIEQLKIKFPSLQVEFSEEEIKDWMEEWKKHFTAFSLVENFWVIPSWQKKPNDQVKPIWIDPGLAFGTGTHATTQLAAAHIYNLLQENSSQTLIDVGTGTGILAILAKHLGASQVDATEIDEMARQTAKENVEINQVAIHVFDEQIDTLQAPPYDIVVANIIDGVLVEVQNDLARLLKPGGHFVLSGILAEREDYFIKNFIEVMPNIKVLCRTQKEEWLGLVIQKQ